MMADEPKRCPECGYTKEDALIHWDHHLCKGKIPDESGLNSVLNSLRKTYSAIGEAEAVAANIPNDRYVLANLISLKRDAEQLERLWEEECRNAQIEVCRYRILPEHEKRYTLNEPLNTELDELNRKRT